LTDLYPDEEGVLIDGVSVAICQAANTITALAGVALGTTATSGVISIVAGGLKNSIGLAMKAGVTGDMIPVLFYGIAKLTAGAVITEGDSIQSGTTAGTFLPLAARTAGELVTLRGIDGTGTEVIIGKALQEAAATGDEFLALISPF
jgi:hypothetical protein